MNSCKVFVINEVLSKEDVTFAAKPKEQLRAVPFGATKKQIVRSVASDEPLVFAVFDAATSIAANISGMAIFLTISSSSEEVLSVKGKVNIGLTGMVAFKVDGLDVGFYSYEICVKAANDYSQRLLSGSYVVQA